MGSFLLINAKSKEEICEDLGAKIKACRLWRGMSQDDLAQKSGLTRKTINHIESGHASLDSIVAVAIALDITEQLNNIFVPKPQSIQEITSLNDIKDRQRIGKKKP